MALRYCSFEQMKAVFFSPFYLFLFFFASVLFMLKLAKRTKTKTNLNLPPTPPKLPIIGNLHQLGQLPHHSFRNLSSKYGDMMMLQLGQMQNPTLVVSSAHVVMEMMKNHDLVFSNRPQMTAAKILLYGCTDVGFGNYGEDWKQKRRICVLELLSMKRVQSFHAIREEEVAEFVSKLHEASLRDDITSSVNLSQMLLSTANNIVCKCSLGKKFTGESGSHSRVNELARHVMIHLTAFTVGDYFPLLGWIDVLRGKIQEFKATFAELDALFDQVIAEHLSQKREKGKDFVDILLQIQEDSMLQFEFTKSDLKALLMDMFVGGTDSTTAALEWAVSRLMKHPSTMKKAQEEVRKVVGHKSKIEEKDVNQMHYLKCVVKETLRLHPPTPLLAPRETASDVKLKGYDIPAKTMVYINAWAIQRDPEFWENPEEFKPERFENSQIDFKIQDFNLLPFGFGRRGCPGMNFGIASVEYVLANLLCWFDWKLPETDSSHIQDIDMSEVFGLVVSRKVPLHLKPITFSFDSTS